MQERFLKPALPGERWATAMSQRTSCERSFQCHALHQIDLDRPQDLSKHRGPDKDLTTGPRARRVVSVMSEHICAAVLPR